MQFLKLRCQPLDELLGGGLEIGSITEIYGEPGSGKTNFCLQASRECVLSGKKVGYITAGSISSERLKQLCENDDCRNIPSEVLFFNPSNYEEQEEILHEALKIKNLGLLVLDSFNAFYRLMVEDDETYANRSLNRQITELQIAANENDISVIIAGQVYSAENDDVKPFGGRIIERMVKTILKFEKIRTGNRQATIIKHPSQPIGNKTIFSITAVGLE